MTTQIYTSRACLNHITGGSHEDYGHVPEHPERPARLAALLDLFAEPPFNTLKIIEGQPADMAQLRYAHPDSYINKIQDMIPDRGLVNVENEVVLSPGTWDAALIAAGAVCQAVDDVMTGKCRRAFCAVRPPGHHAVADRAMGFCVFANAFIGARQAQVKHGIKRVAVVDFDVHHGNGTDSLARKADGIFLISSHQFPLWPGTGLPQYDEPGKTLNIPLPPGSGSAEFRAAYEKTVFPALEKFKPELVMISAGFDAHRDDPLAQMNLTEDDYTWVTENLSVLADKFASGRIVSTLEGGYDIAALKASAAAHLKTLAKL